MIEPINFLGALRQRWRLVVVLAVIGAVLALLAPSGAAKHPTTALRWETFASVGAPASSGIIQGTVSNEQILFYSNTFPVKLAAVQDVGLKGDPYTFAGGMFGSTVGTNGKGAYPTIATSTTPTSSKKAQTGGLVTLYASAQTPVLAADLCNAYARELGNTLEQVAAAHAASVPTSGKVSSSESSAAAEDSPFASTSTGYQVIFPGTPQLAHKINGVKSSTLDSHKTRLLIGLVGGALVGLLIILIRELLNRSVRRASRAEAHFKFPVIAEIPETYPPDPGIVDVVDRPTSPAAEAYRKLRMSVLFEAMASDTSTAANDPFVEMFGVSSPQTEAYEVPEAGSRSVLLVLSSIDEPSRSKVVANLAATYAEASERVIVVSTSDLEVGTTFPGENVHAGPITEDDVERRLTPAGPEHVYLLSMRHFIRNSGQLVTRSKDVFDAARGVADVVLVEAPAFLRYHHGEAMVHSVDAILVVSESGATEAPDAIDMGEVLRRLGAPVLGVVFTGEELSANQRKVLRAGMAASGSNRPALAATATEVAAPSGEPEAPESAPDSDISDATPELHPT